MKINVGKFDRYVRAALGVALLAFAVLSGGPTGVLMYGAALVGIVMLAVSMIGICPIYSLLGLKTCKACD